METEAFIEIMEGAKSAIIEKGHAKWKRVDGAGGMCLIGAIAFAANEDPWVDIWTCRVVDESYGIVEAAGIANHLFTQDEDPFWAAVMWNNADERTPEEVLGLLDAAIIYKKEQDRGDN